MTTARQLSILPTAPPAIPPWAGMTPRAWQAEALVAAEAAIAARTPSIISAIMGAGKSILIAEICARHPGQIVVTAPSVALVDQLSATIARRCPGQVGRYYTRAKEAGHRIVVACMPSLSRLADDPALSRPVTLWICDEAHRSECDRVIAGHEALSPVAAIGVTATPYRADDREELSLWRSLAYEYGVARAIADGVVVPWRPIQWTGGRVTLDAACTAMIRRHGLPAGPGLVSARTIDDAEDYAAALRRDRIPAAAVHSRLPRPLIAERIQRLRTGEIKAIVHVSMLAEGVDLPWLRWLCCRRQVASRVRWCQEVGRVLRSAPGKREALILDPLDQLGDHAMSYEEVLAGQARASTTPPLDEPLEDLRDLDGDTDDDPITRWARRTAAWRRYLRRLLAAAVAAGVVEVKVTSTHWRSDPATDAQLAVVSRALAGMGRDTTIPIAHRRELAAVGEARSRLSKGDISDLLSIAFALRDDRRHRRRRQGPPAWEQMIAAAQDPA